MYNVLKTIAAGTTGGNGVNIDEVGPGGKADTHDLVTSISNIVNAVIGVLGIVCVVVMIVGGVNYMTSAGDSNKVKKAKDTILYGLVGLVICALAFAIVNFVIRNIINATPQ